MNRNIYNHISSESENLLFCSEIARSLVQWEEISPGKIWGFILYHRGLVEKNESNSDWDVIVT